MGILVVPGKPDAFQEQMGAVEQALKESVDRPSAEDRFLVLERLYKETLRTVHSLQRDVKALWETVEELLEEQDED